MKNVGLFEAKAKLSEICGKVSETGEVYTITRRGKPIVRIEPILAPRTGSDIWDQVEESRRKYGPPEVNFKLPKRRTNPRKNLFD